jgi:cell division transport system ATP-binding protein
VLQLIQGFLAPSGGHVRVAGEEPTKLGRIALAALRRAIGVVPPDLQLLADRSVLENVMLPALAAGLSRRAASERARAALARVELSETEERPAALAGSDQLRAALARAIVNRPALLLADEPAALLDAPAAAVLLRMLEEFVRAGVTVMMASHSGSAPLDAHARCLRLIDGALSR